MTSSTPSRDSSKVRIGVVGCGNIAPHYLKMGRRFDILEMTACADKNPQAAQRLAEQFQIPRVLSVDQLLQDRSIDIVLNLTVPLSHADITLRALSEGKHVYCEKPLAVTRHQGEAIRDQAHRRKLHVGCAPDTFMGAGLQTARRAIDSGIIGRPLAFTAAMMCPGHESWHPSPEFYYQPGGGPMMDMGPYYLTALMNLLGPAKRLMGMTSVAIDQRVIGSGEKAGKRFPVETYDHVAGIMEFAQGAVGNVIMSFATHFAQMDGKTPIILYGENGTMRVPDPNGFGGVVSVRKKDDEDFKPLPAVFTHEYGRSVGLADMADAIRAGRPLRASLEQSLAVLDAMLGFSDSSQSGRAYEPVMPYARPAPMPTDAPFGVFDT